MVFHTFKAFARSFSANGRSFSAASFSAVRMLSLSVEEREQLGKNGRQAVLEHFTYQQLAEQFEELFDVNRGGNK